MARNSVKLINAALDEIAIAKIGNQIVLRGVLENDSFDLLQVSEYQREVLAQSKIMELVDAMKTGSVPDVELGMRGGSFREGEGAFYLQDPVFIIDGLQRVTAVKHMLRLLGQEGVRPPRLGATVYFNTTEEWERERFKILNLYRAKLSPNVLLRNRRHDYSAVETMYNLATEDKTFVLKGRICWNQGMTRQELISAQTYLRVVGYLHSHLGPTRACRGEELTKGIQKVMSLVGRNIFRENIRTFFDVLDQAFGIRVVTFKEGAAYLKFTFMTCLAEIFSNHFDFWRENKLFVEADLIRKIKLFPLADPNVRNLCSAGGMANRLLYRLLVDHINRGKTSRRLKERVIYSESEAEESSDAVA